MHTASRTPKLCPKVRQRKPLGAYTLKAGYAFHLVDGKLWAHSESDDWEIVVTDSDPQSTPVGALRIDDAPCIVFLCCDGDYRAQVFTWAGCAEVER